MLKNILNRKKRVQLLRLRFNMFLVNVPIRIISEPNVPLHWAKRRKMHKSHETCVNTFFSRHIDFSKIKLPIRFTLTRVGPRKLDDDNLIASLKHVRDHLTSKVFPEKARGQGDGGTEIQWAYSQEKGPPKTYGLKIKLESIG